MALDPSKGSDSRRGDYSALVMLGVDRQGMVYVEADLARRPTPQIVADGVEWYRRFRPDVFGIEANQFQDLLAGEFEAEFRRQGMLGAPALADREPHQQAGPHPPAGAVSVRRGGCDSRAAVPARGCWSSSSSSFPSATTTTVPTPRKWPCVWRPNCCEGRGDAMFGDRLPVGHEGLAIRD